MVPTTIDSLTTSLSSQYQIIKVVDLDLWHGYNYSKAQEWLENQCREIFQEEYTPQQRIIFTLTDGDYYVKSDLVGLILKNLQHMLTEVDISDFFVILITSNPDIKTEIKIIEKNIQKSWGITVYSVEKEFKKYNIEQHPISLKELYRHGSSDPFKTTTQYTERENFLLSESKVFCIYPWIHMHALPTGEAWPCCHIDRTDRDPLGNCRQQTLEEIWNSENMQELRRNMLSEKSSNYCNHCYEQEKSGFFSGRQHANKYHGHKIYKINETSDLGQLNNFELSYWDIRFSNLCNLKCRTCDHTYSSQWYQDQAKIKGQDWEKKNIVLNFAGQNKSDMWDQLLTHIDYVEQIYFAGGEPLLMEEHYLILEELEKRKKFNVRLFYNTNFTHVKLKDRLVFDYWKKFQNVSVGASLDASGVRAEYIRKGTNWSQIEENRLVMMKICPDVDFFISPTLSIMNAWHLPDFHRDWVERGFIQAEALNITILLGPSHYRIDIGTPEFKQRINEKYLKHIDWLKPQDTLYRATLGYESAINFMALTDNSKMLSNFWKITNKLDKIRNENIIDAIPELSELQVQH